MLWTATGRQFGLNPVTVRPSRPALQPLYRTYPTGYQGYGYWTLFGVNGGDAFQIVNTCGCGSTGGTGVSACSCGGADISIPDDVNSITSVTIDGVLLDSPDLPAQGGGEPAIVNMGAVIANAVFDATGVRFTQLPITKARVKAARAK